MSNNVCCWSLYGYSRQINAGASENKSQSDCLEIFASNVIFLDLYLTNACQLLVTKKEVGYRAIIF